VFTRTRVKAYVYIDQMEKCNDLKLLIKDFIEDLRDNVFTTDDERGDMMLVEFFFEKLHPEMVMKHVVDNLLPHKSKVARRDETFFLDNRIIFSGIPEDRIDHYAEYINHRERISDDNRATIYEYFDEMIKIAEAYKKDK